MQISAGPIITPDGNPIVLAAPTTNITMTGLSAFQLLTLFGYGFTHNGADALYTLQLHELLSATWITAGYHRLGSVNGGITSAWSIGGSAVVPAATSSGFLVNLLNFNSIVPVMADIDGGRIDSATAATAAAGYLGDTPAQVAYDGFRIQLSTGDNLVTGTLIPLGVRG